MKNNTKLMQVVMLPTEKAELWQLYKYNDKLYYGVSGQSNTTQKEYQCYHLYIVSDKPKVGDWQINHLTNKISQRIDSPLEITVVNCSKIIATTDSSLKINVHNRDIYGLGQILPQIPQSFVEAFVKAEGKITEVSIEIEKTYPYRYDLGNESVQVKTRADNSIIIRPSKVYTREEVIQLINKVFNDARIKEKSHDIVGYNFINTKKRFKFQADEWIETNL